MTFTADCEETFVRSTTFTNDYRRVQREIHNLIAHGVADHDIKRAVELMVRFDVGQEDAERVAKDLIDGARRFQ